MEESTAFSVSILALLLQACKGVKLYVQFFTRVVTCIATSLNVPILVPERRSAF